MDLLMQIRHNKGIWTCGGWCVGGTCHAVQVITPPMKGWVDLIRQHGNKATHSLESPDKKRAESTLMFTAELLRLIYEMEHLSMQYTEETWILGWKDYEWGITIWSSHRSFFPFYVVTSPDSWVAPVNSIFILLGFSEPIFSSTTSKAFLTENAHFGGRSRNK